jgi:hypothetical protein
MSAPVPFLPPVLALVDEILTTKKIPALSGDEMEALCSHLFALRDRDQRITIAEVAYLNHDDPQALISFWPAPCQWLKEWPNARQSGYLRIRRTGKSRPCTIGRFINMFDVNRPIRPFAPNAFQRYLIITIFHGAMTPFRFRPGVLGYSGCRRCDKV